MISGSVSCKQHKPCRKFNLIIFSIIETASSRVEGKAYAPSKINFRCEHNENDDYEKFKQWNGIVVHLSRIRSIISLIIAEIFYCEL